MDGWICGFVDLWMCGFIRRSLLATYNNLFYRIHFIVFIVRLLLFWFFFSFFFVTLCWTRNKTEMDVWLCQTKKPVNTYNANEKLETSTP